MSLLIEITSELIPSSGLTFQGVIRGVIGISSIILISFLYSSNKKNIEKLKNEFSQVQRSYIPMNAIIRIDEVNETGDAKIKENKNLLLPVEMYLSPLEFFTKIKEYKVLEWNRTVHEKEAVLVDCNSVEQPKFNKNFDILVKSLEEWEKKE